MKSIVSLVVTLGIGLGIYYIFLKQAAPTGTNAPITSVINTTGVEMDLTSIAQAERMYNTQNGSYATFDQLVEAGDITMSKPGRENYTYTVDAGGTCFTVTAKWTAPPGTPANVHYPTMTIDQTMELHRINE
jgi:hypothetical protein